MSAYFECEEKKECLDWVETAVDEVAHEEVVRVGNIAAHFEQLLEVVELAVDVAANLENESSLDQLVAHSQKSNRINATKATNQRCGCSYELWLTLGKANLVIG